jgi:hypothetical protein
MRRLVAGASSRCCILVAFLAFTVGAGPARASEWRDLDERIAELEQTTVRAGTRRLTFNMLPAASWQGFVIGARIQF